MWFDLGDVYLVFESNTYLDNKIKNEDFLLAFLNETETELFSSWGFSK